MDDFHEKFVPKKYMPSNYGGELPSTFELNGKQKNQVLLARDCGYVIGVRPIPFFDFPILKATVQRCHNNKIWHRINFLTNFNDYNFLNFIFQLLFEKGFKTSRIGLPISTQKNFTWTKIKDQRARCQLMLW